MAEKRMFANRIIDSDAFLDMPMSARLLYYDLAMRADDDGFVDSPKKIMKIIGASNDDMNILIMRKFILHFPEGIIVIKHWYVHNYIRQDTYRETTYKEEKALLELDENKAYRIAEKPCEKELPKAEEKNLVSKKYGEYKNVMLTDDDFSALQREFPKDYQKRIDELSSYIASSGKKYKNHLATIRNWARREKQGSKSESAEKSYDLEMFKEQSLKPLKYKRKDNENDG